MASDTLTIDSSTSAQQPAAAGVKTILFHVQNDASLDQRLETALSLARACDANLTCLHVTPIEAYVAFDNFGGVFVMNDVIKALDEDELALRTRVEEKLRSEAASWNYIQVTGNVPSQIIGHAALADLIIVGREPHKSAIVGPTISLLGDLLHRSRTPLFIPSTDGGPVDPSGIVIIAWDGSHEAANAVRASVGLLKLATDVRVVQVKEIDKNETFPSIRLLEYLSRHGIHADLHAEPASEAKGEAVTGILLAHAKATSAAYIVMGGYSHSRIGQYLFGGVTRTLLAGSPVPLLMTH